MEIIMNPNYEQDNIRLFNADCMDIMIEYPNKYFDLAVVDPPYGLDKKSIHGRGHIKDKALGKGSKKMDKWDYAPKQRYFDELFRISKNYIIWGGNYFSLGRTRCVIVWDKIQYFKTYSQVELAYTSFDRPCPLFRYSNNSAMNKEPKNHPTHKPIQLYNWLYYKFAKPGQKIIDTHLGMGSNAIAAHYANMGEFVGIEIDEEYFDDSCKRIYNETRQLELF